VIKIRRGEKRCKHFYKTCATAGSVANKPDIRPSMLLEWPNFIITFVWRWPATCLRHQRPLAVGHQHPRSRGGPRSFSCPPRRRFAELPLSDLVAAHGLRQKICLVGEGQAGGRLDGARGRIGCGPS